MEFTTASSSIASCYIHDASWDFLRDELELLFKDFSLQSQLVGVTFACVNAVAT